MVKEPIYGRNISVDKLDSIHDYILFTIEEPWSILKKRVSNDPKMLSYNHSMDISHLSNLYNGLEFNIGVGDVIVGIGGGTACDTAKYIAWKLKEDRQLELDLILIPSIISVDAFLCSSIAIREANKVTYVGETSPKEIIIDFDLIQQAPEFLNRAGVSDTISITSALGDWLIARDEVDEEFDLEVFHQAKRIVEDLLKAKDEISEISEKGIKAMVQGFYKEVKLCEKWGNARPEEGSEHFLAYCLESITGKHYIHGNLIGMNVLISLYLQQEYAQFEFEDIENFFKRIHLNYKPSHQNIPKEDLINSLNKVQNYVQQENLFYSLYNSPNTILSDDKIKEIVSFLKN